MECSGELGMDPEEDEFQRRIRLAMQQLDNSIACSGDPEHSSPEPSDDEPEVPGDTAVTFARENSELSEELVLAAQRISALHREGRLNTETGEVMQDEEVDPTLGFAWPEMAQETMSGWRDDGDEEERDEDRVVRETPVLDGAMLSLLMDAGESNGPLLLDETVTKPRTLGPRGRRRQAAGAVSYTHLRAHETPEHLVCRLLLEKKKKDT
eukprot:TRINITY_DN15428_c0_g1_i4.p2 TRINITY_DN15428_c0_g1~~TRINITY_DN15428_c0_g1_i4.p2  ORF type:complete len:210 (+),score=56.68 TRINITY_DN15428_c0_g1_i4:235-864(+)